MFRWLLLTWRAVGCGEGWMVRSSLLSHDIVVKAGAARVVLIVVVVVIVLLLLSLYIFFLFMLLLLLLLICYNYYYYHYYYYHFHYYWKFHHLRSLLLLPSERSLVASLRDCLLAFESSLVSRGGRGLRNGWTESVRGRQRWRLALSQCFSVGKLSLLLSSLLPFVIRKSPKEGLKAMHKVEAKNYLREFVKMQGGTKLMKEGTVVLYYGEGLLLLLLFFLFIFFCVRYIFAAIIGVFIIIKNYSIKINDSIKN